MIIAYEETLSGSTDRIIALTEKQQAHRHQWENRELGSGISMAKRGQVFGFILGMCGLGVTVFLAYSGLLLIPGIVGVASTIGLIGSAVQSFLKKPSEKDTRP